MRDAIAGEPWVKREPVPHARARLFCIAHAGGGAAAFRGWREGFAPEIELCAIVLPGRDGRRREPPHTRLANVVDPLFTALHPLADRPFALFGHSMGAAIAFELARRFAASPLGRPLRLCVSGRRAPHLSARRRSFYDLPEDEFVRVIAAMNGTPADVLRDDAMRRLFLPCLRADFELIETWAPAPGPALTCPVSAFAGDADPEVNPGELAAWSRVTTGEFRSRMFAGDHFYLRNAHPPLLAALREDLAHDLGVSRGA
jgi:medium-chain acyl-[acyl-carrier-protein] hydrolase